jgi:NAD(P)-dependent dehydrogenase (short-subunit alcohol dehydrogenase family)
MSEDRIAIVTGASRGIGKGVAVALGAAGLTVYCTGRSTTARPTYPHLGGTVEETAAAVTAAGGRGVPVACDHSHDTQVRAFFSGLDRIDLLVNNVWGGYRSYHEDRYDELAGPFWEQPLRVWDDMFVPGVRAHYTATALAVPKMRSGGLVVTISNRHSPGYSAAYNVAKAADDAMIASFAPQLAERGITAVSLQPGLVRTEGVLRAGDHFDLTGSQSPELVGRAVEALARDPKVCRHNGTALTVAEVAASYGLVG